MDELAALNLGGHTELDLALHNDGRAELNLGGPTATSLHRTLIIIIIIIMMVMIIW